MIKKILVLFIILILSTSVVYAVEETANLKFNLVKANLGVVISLFLTQDKQNSISIEVSQPVKADVHDKNTNQLSDQSNNQQSSSSGSPSGGSSSSSSSSGGGSSGGSSSGSSSGGSGGGGSSGGSSNTPINPNTPIANKTSSSNPTSQYTTIANIGNVEVYDYASNGKLYSSQGYLDAVIGYNSIYIFKGNLFTTTNNVTLQLNQTINQLSTDPTLLPVTLFGKKAHIVAHNFEQYQLNGEIYFNLFITEDMDNYIKTKNQTIPINFAFFTENSTNSKIDVTNTFIKFNLKDYDLVIQDNLFKNNSINLVEYKINNQEKELEDFLRDFYAQLGP